MRHKCLASFIVFLLFFTISGLIVLAELKDFSRPETIIKTLGQSGIYENLPKLIETSLQNQQEKDLEAAALAKTIIKSLDPQTLKQSVEKDLPPLISYFNGKGPLPDIKIDLGPFKTRFQEVLPIVLTEEAANLPTCTGHQTISDTIMPSCLPPGTNASDIGLQAQKTGLAYDLLKNVPDFWSLSDLKNPDQVFGRIILAFKILNYSFWGMLIISIILIIFLLLLGRHYWPSIPRWVGLALILPGASMLLLTFVALALPQIVINYFSKGVDPEVLKFINPMITALSQSSQKISLFYSGLVGGLGVILIILSYALPHPPEPKPAPKSAVVPQTPAPQATQK